MQHPWCLNISYEEYKQLLVEQICHDQQIQEIQQQHNDRQISTDFEEEEEDSTVATSKALFESRADVRDVAEQRLAEARHLEEISVNLSHALSTIAVGARETGPVLSTLSDEGNRLPAPPPSPTQGGAVRAGFSDTHSPLNQLSSTANSPPHPQRGGGAPPRPPTTTPQQQQQQQSLCAPSSQGVQRLSVPLAPSHNSALSTLSQLDQQQQQLIQRQQKEAATASLHDYPFPPHSAGEGNVEVASAGRLSGRVEVNVVARQGQRSVAPLDSHRGNLDAATVSQSSTSGSEVLSEFEPYYRPPDATDSTILVPVSAPPHTQEPHITSTTNLRN